MITPDAFFMIACLIGVILLVVFTLFYCPLPKNKKRLQDANKDELDSSGIISFLKASGSTKDNLYYLVDSFLKHYSQLNLTSQQVKDFFKAVYLHCHTNVQIILRTQNVLASLNPTLKSQLNKIVEIRAGII